MTETNTTTAPAAPRSLYWGVTSHGQAVIGLGRVLDEYVEAAAQAKELSLHDLEAVQADEACWIATHGWLWQGLVEARTQADLNELAWACDEQARDRQDGGHGWAAEVWEAVASYLWRLAAA